MKKIVLLPGLFCGLLAGCSMNNTKSPTAPGAFEFQGLLKQQGITTYQYGTHTISNDSITYALKSSTVNLDSYIDKRVTIKGTRVDGYPIENGPDFIDVKELR